MEQAEQRKRIMIDLDSILDTRCGLMTYYDLLYKQSKAIPAILDKGYRERTMDKWIADKVFGNYEEWRTFWNKRGRFPILPLSIQTNTIHALLTYVDEMVIEQVRPITGYEFDLVINVFPYTLEAADLNEICELIHEQVPNFGEVTSVRLSPKEVSPEYFKENLDSLWTYDLKAWTDEHLEWLMKNPRPTIQLIVPKLIHPIDSKEEIGKDEQKVIDEIDPFELTAVTLSPFVSIHFLEVENYCIEPDIVLKLREN